jgi:hypothetical protein
MTTHPRKSSCWLATFAVELAAVAGVPGRPRSRDRRGTRRKRNFGIPFVFSEGTSDCKKFWVTDLRVIGKARSPALQTTVSAQPIREDEIANFT